MHNLTTPSPTAPLIREVAPLRHEGTSPQRLPVKETPLHATPQRPYTP